MKESVCLLLAVLLILTACPAARARADKTEGIYVKKVEGLPEDFIFGMDVSTILSQEKSGVTYRNFEGRTEDLFSILQKAGINYIRVRVWNDPYDAQGHGYGGGNCDVAVAAEIGRRAAEHGMKLLVDFHYSDFWADPNKQMVPKAWEGFSLAEKENAFYSWTLESLNAIRAGGADVGMVQIGNETNAFLCGERDWDSIVRLMAAGCRAVRKFDPGVKTVIHLSDPNETDKFLGWVSELERRNLDYDVLGISYYSFWHDSPENLTYVMNTVRTKYGKDVMVAETSYAWTDKDSDFSGNTLDAGGYDNKPWPFTVQGQANAVREATAAVQRGGGLGIFYWEGAWITVGTVSREENQRKWEKYGSGWATSYAAAYDPNDAGRYYGGSAWDNQAFFDAEGRPLESLKVFRLMRDGRETALTVDSVEECSVTVETGRRADLPDTVRAVMNDGSRKDVPVVWQLPAGGFDSSREGTYVVRGTAEGLEARCTVRVVRPNYAKNPSFEEDDLSMWRCEDLGGAEQLYCEDKEADSLTGTKHWHFWTPRAKSARFTLEQELSLSTGRYVYSISVMGGDAGDQEIYTYVRVNGVTVGTAPAVITSYNNWDTPAIPFSCTAGDRVVCGIYVRCDGAGAWGKIDDMQVVYAAE